MTSSDDRSNALTSAAPGLAQVVRHLGVNHGRGVHAVAERTHQFFGAAAAAQTLDDGARPCRREPREHHVVHQRGRLLVAHADAGGGVDADRLVGAGVADSGAGGIRERRRDGIASGHFGGGAGVDVDRGAPAVFAGEEVVEGRGAFYVHPGQVHFLGHDRDGLVGDGPEPLLHLTQHGE